MSLNQENLKQWAVNNGSELLKVRIENGFSWIPLARNEWVKSLLPDKTWIAPQTEGYAKPWDQPTLSTIKAFLSVKEAFKDFTPVVELYRVEYEEEYPDPTTVTAELELTVISPDGEEITRWIHLEYIS